MATLPQWPSELPQSPLMDGLDIVRLANSIETNMDVGDPKSRRRFTGRRSIMTFGIIVTAYQKSIFDNFYDNTLVDGNQPFTWTDIETGETAVTFVFEKDSPPKHQPIGGTKWRIDMAIRRIY
jgi:hypothetical protein